MTTSEPTPQELDTLARTLPKGERLYEVLSHPSLPEETAADFAQWRELWVSIHLRWIDGQLVYVPEDDDSRWDWSEEYEAKLSRAGDSGAPLYQLLELLMDPDPRVRAEAASNWALPHEIVSKVFWNDPSDYVCWSAGNNIVMWDNEYGHYKTVHEFPFAGVRNSVLQGEDFWSVPRDRYWVSEEERKNMPGTGRKEVPASTEEPPF